MTKGRLEAFSDGVIAIIITIMVLELHPPHVGTFAALREVAPVLAAYVLSFVYVGIYWNNHHHLLHTVQKVDGAILWANLHLLFWLSLTPFASAWMGENCYSPATVALYGVVLLMSGTAYYILVQALLRRQGSGSTLAKAVGNDFKGKISVVLYAIAIALSFVASWVSLAIYAAVACIWLVPDRRMEKVLGEE